jgi:hypothetical protein
MVFGFDEFVELLRQFGLNGAPEGAEAEAMARCARGAFLFVGTNGEGTIPGEGVSASYEPEVAGEIES